MPVSNDFLEFFLDQLSGWRDVSSRKMFGGVGLYCEEVTFAFIADDVVYFKVNDTNRAQYEAAECGPFKPFKNQTTVLSYYELPAEILESREELAEWAEQSLMIQLEK